MNREFFIENKKKIIIIVAILAISLIGFSLVNSTYSLFYHEDVASNTDSYSTGLLSISAKGKSENISLNGALPMTDIDGTNGSQYIFTISNTGNLDYKFNIKLLSTGDSSSSIDTQYIRIKVDDGEVVTLADLSNGIIKSDITLLAGESIDMTIRIWLNINTPNSQIGKTFNSKIVIDGQAIYTTSNNDAYGGGAKTITDLFAANGTAVNNNVTYQYDTTHSLMRDVGGNIRYYGASPNNYIYFNCSDYSNQSSSTCELWRIIGVVDGKLKLIRNSSIGSFSWDNKGTSSGAEINIGKNDWTSSRLMKMLNSGFDSETGGSLYWNRKSGNCYSGTSADAITTCDLSSNGLINDTTRNMIADTMWYLGGYQYSDIYVDQAYRAERGTTVYSGRPITWSGKVGLVYSSDYGYAVDLNKCNQQLILYNNSTCTANNWMYTSMNTSWTISSSSWIPSSVYVVSGGIRSEVDANSLAEIFPSIYLNNSVNLSTTGNGSQSNPYRIDMSNSGIETYTITYDLNGGTGTIPSQTKIAGQPITLSSVVPTKSGYTFKGWLVSSNSVTAGSDMVIYQPGSTFDINGNVTLIAGWASDTASYFTVLLQRKVGNSISTLTSKVILPTKMFSYSWEVGSASVTGTSVPNTVSCTNGQNAVLSSDGNTYTVTIASVTADTVCTVSYSSSGSGTVDM